MDIIKQIEKEQVAEVIKNREVPDFKSGDTLKVNVYVTEGNKERIQAFEGICIARSNRGFNSTFTVRKISHGEGVERVFPLYSPMLESIKLVRKGKVRRSKLYYLRQRSGKSARIAEKKDLIKKTEKKLQEDSVEKKKLDKISNKDIDLDKKSKKIDVPSQKENKESKKESK